MGFRGEDISAVISRLASNMGELEQELNRADAKLGDGDTGTMLARVVSALAAVEAQSGDVGATFSAYARATAIATGSSLGTLIATGFLSAAKTTKAQHEVDWSQMSEILATARDAMLARGGANLGDKTVLDGLDAIAKAVDGKTTRAEIATAAPDAANDALERFRDKANKIGRARMFEDNSKGLDDPGMLALAKVCTIIGS